MREPQLKKNCNVANSNTSKPEPNFSLTSRLPCRLTLSGEHCATSPQRSCRARLIWGTALISCKVTSTLWHCCCGRSGCAAQIYFKVNLLRWIRDVYLCMLFIQLLMWTNRTAVTIEEVCWKKAVRVHAYFWWCLLVNVQIIAIKKFLKPWYRKFTIQNRAMDTICRQISAYVKSTVKKRNVIFIRK